MVVVTSWGRWTANGYMQLSKLPKFLNSLSDHKCSSCSYRYGTELSKSITKTYRKTGRQSKRSRGMRPNWMVVVTSWGRWTAHSYMQLSKLPKFVNSLSDHKCSSCLYRYGAELSKSITKTYRKTGRQSK